MGVGTVTIKMLQAFKSSVLAEKAKPLFALPFKATCIPAKSASSVRSSPLFNSATRLASISKPNTGYFFPNSMANGKPT